MNLTPLKYFLFIENVTTVFRNYLCLKMRSRIIVLVWIFIDAIIISLTAVHNFAPEMKRRGQDRMTYFCMSTGFSVYLLMASLYYSKRFYRLLLNFDTFYKCFNDGVYYKKLLRAQTIFTCRAVLFCGVITFLFTFLRLLTYLPSSAGSMEWIISLLSVFCNSVSDVRYMLQYFVMHCILFVVSEQLKAITRSVQSELSAIKDIRKDVEHAENLPSVAVNNNKFNKWVKAYENINDSCNLCNIMFSVQLSIMLLMVTVYYIILMYAIALLTVMGLATFTSLLPAMLSMAVFLTALIVISYAGQQIQNSYAELLQKLGELCVHLALENEEYYKLTKDFLRYVRTRPVRMHVFGTLEVNMSMLPSVVAFFTTYTVIALQFNNVL